MKNVSLDNYLYFPTLRTRQAELKGLEMLDAERKSQIIPLLTLGRWPKASDFSRSAVKAQEAMSGSPYFLDLTTDARHLTDHHKALRTPAGAFEAWRTFCADYPDAIPVVQGGSSRIREFVKQAQSIERLVGITAFRIRDFSTDTPLVISALSALDDPENAIVFIDCQYIRSALSAYVTASVATINQLREEFPTLLISVLSTSFPASTASFADETQKRGSIDIQERELHSRIGGNDVAIYGDHASIHSVVYDDVPIMRFAARVDYPREFDWYFERRPQDRSVDGYIDAASAVRSIDPEIGTRKIWGEDMIIKAAEGASPGAPGPWISIRVNIHLSRQIDFSRRLANESDADLDEDQ